MKTTILLNLVVMLLTATLAPAATRLVPDEYATIQAAIDAAVDGDVVIIAPNTYTGPGNRDIDFGGKAITVQSTDPQDPAVVAATVIDCQGTETSPHRGFKFHSGEGPDSVLAGLTITNGYGPDEQTAYGRSVGGGIYILSNPTITHCVISNNYSESYGGAISTRGQGSPSPKISYCTIVGNSTNSSGGGIYCKPDTNAAISHCIIAGNTASRGGGIWCYANDPSNVTKISHCTIANNSASRYGGGISTSRASLVDHCIVWGNNADDGAPDMSGRPSISYSNVGEDVFAGTGNISVDPCFIDPSNGDYHLSALSACVNAGDPCYSSTVGDTDMDGEPRVIFGRIDIGADEFYDDGPFIYISPTTFVFEVDEGGANPEAQILFVRNAGNDKLKWQASEYCSWLEVDPNNGQSTGEIDEAFLNVDISRLSAGLYNCEVTITDSCALNRYQKVCVTLHIDDGDDVLHVPSEYRTIQGAIDWAEPNDTVIVADGIYTGEGNRDIDFRGKAITVRSENGPEKCVIDCQGTETDPHRGFIFQNGEGPDSALTGLTIMNGYASRGGGIYCTGYSSPTLTNCMLIGNSADYGGGMYIVDSSSPTIINCKFSDNLAVCGGGMYSSGGTPTLVNCVFSANFGGAGGGILNGWCDELTLTNCTFVRNFARTHGGGIYIPPPPVPAGGSSVSKYYSTCIIKNCIFWDNIDSQGINESAQIKFIEYTVQPPVINYSCIKGWTGNLGGVGNIGDNPCFVDLGYWADANDPNIIVEPNDPNAVWIDGDYYLKSAGWRWHRQRKVWMWDEVTSPCIDAGNPGSPLGDELMSVPDDPNNEWGENLRINMGAYGGTAEASMAPPGWALLSDLSNDAIVNFVDLALQVQDWLTTANEQPGNLNRDAAVNMIDFAILAKDWLKRKPFVVKITKPENGAEFYYYETIEIEADAWCFCCSVVKVEFFANGTKIGEDNYGSDGWKTNWEGDHARGSYNLTTKATNDNGATTVSLAVAIRIDGGEPPPL